MRLIPLIGCVVASYLGIFLGIASSGFAQTTVETVRKTSFSDPQILRASDSLLEGEIFNALPVPAPVTLSPFLTSQQVTILDPIISLGFRGDPFIAWIENNPLNEDPNLNTFPDTLLRSFSETGAPISTDDNSSPVGGDGKASALLGTVNDDDTIRLSVTGFGDSGFTGNHMQEGPFDLFVAIGELDVDFYSYRDLVPGSEFSIELDETGLEKTLVWLDDDGETLEAVFDTGPLCIGGEEVQVVPASGILNFAITGGQDGNADGVPDTLAGSSDTRIGIGTGTYVLRFVPEPHNVWMSITALAVLTTLSRLGGAHRRRS